MRGSNHDRNTLHGQIFMDMLALRMAGYYRYYGNQLMPIDLYDHFSTHFVLCKLIDREYLPIACLRSISSTACGENGAEFLPVTRTRTSNPELSSHVNDLLKKANLNIDYDSGLTVSPKITSTRENYEILKQMIGSCLLYHYEHQRMPFLISSIKKTKTDRLFQKVGFQPICPNNDYHLKGLESEDFSLLIFNSENLNHALWTEPSLALWHDKVEIEPSYAFTLGISKKNVA